MLIAHPNPFAKVVLAHLKTQETRNDPATRHLWKVRLVRSLYEQGMSAGDVRKLFRFIDWLMDLPRALDTLFWGEVRSIQETLTMPYISTGERVERREGFLEGIRECLDVKFGEQGKVLIPEIESQVFEPDLLRAILKAIKSADKPEDLRRLWSS